MSLLKEFFSPKNKKDAVTLAVIFITVFGFIGFEGYTFMGIMQNPLELNKWCKTAIMPNEDMFTMDNSLLFSKATSLDGYTIFAFELAYLENLNVTMKFDAVNCIIEKMVLASGYRYLTSSKTFPFEPNNMSILNFTNNTVNMDIRKMNYPKNFDIIYIMCKNMEFGTGVAGGIKLLHRVSLIE